MVTIKIIDNGQDRYTLELSTRILGRQYENNAEQIVIEKPSTENESICTMIITYGDVVVDHIIIDSEYTFITSNVSQYPFVNIGFSFAKINGYVKNSEIKRFEFLPAQKPDDFVPVQSEQKQSIEILTQYGIVSAELLNNKLIFKNALGDIVSEVQLSGFVQEQADWNEDDPQNETYIKNKPTTLPNPQKLIIQQGEEVTEYNGSEEKTIVIESGGGKLNLQDLPQFTNKIEIDMSKSTSLAGLLTLPIVESSNFYVNWGDGSGTMYTDATTEISHQYSDTSFTGWITIYGDWKGVQFTQNSDDNKNVIIQVEYDNNITSIVYNSFIKCKNLLSIKIPDSVTSIGTNAFLGTALTKIVLPKNLVEINGSAFYTSDLYDVVIPSKVTTINSMLFWFCTNLNTVILHDNITNIKSNAFYGCSKLKNIKIPQNVTNIGDDVFKDCPMLTEILIEPNSPPVISTSTFTSAINTYYVKYSSLQQYKQATNWSAYADIIYPKGGNYSETITISSTAWDSETKTATVEAIGATSEARNLIIPSVQGNNDNNVRCTAQGTMTLTFACDTIPTEDTVVDVSYILTNKNV